MKIIKYIINLVILTGSIYFLLELSELNQEKKYDCKLTQETTECELIEHEIGTETKIKIPFTDNPDTEEEDHYELEVWLAVLAILTLGVLLGFFIAVFQIISQKGELMSARSKLKRLQIEIDNLRNESIDEDIDIDDIEDIENR